MKPPAAIEEVVAPAPKPAGPLPPTPTRSLASIMGDSSAPNGPDALARTDTMRAYQWPAGDAAGAKAIERTMVSVANGQATSNDLNAVATRDNLSRVENQLVIVADSRDAANKELRSLFAANEWQQADTRPADGAKSAPAKAPAMKASGAAGGSVLKEEKAQAGGVLPAPGFYYLARQNGEDTWVVLTDRANLDRFSSQLAANSHVTIAGESSDEFRKLAQIQGQTRREYAVMKTRGSEIADSPGTAGGAGARSAEVPAAGPAAAKAATGTGWTLANPIGSGPGGGKVADSARKAPSPAAPAAATDYSYNRAQPGSPAGAPGGRGGAGGSDDFGASPGSVSSGRDAKLGQQIDRAREAGMILTVIHVRSAAAEPK
jgi:hypothetical protein